MKVHVDRELCQGCGQCVNGMPANFVLDPKGKSTVKEHINDFDGLSACESAVDTCPNGALYIE